MNKGKSKILLLLINIVIGLLIIVTPIIITGHLYNTSELMGGLLVSDFTMRSISFILGLVVINNGFNKYFSE